MMRKTPAPYRIAAFVGCITLLVFLPALRNGFVNWDDYVTIHDNPHVRNWSAESLWWMLTDMTTNWHPLTWLSHALDYAVWGLDPRGHHLTSILLHGLNACLVVLFLDKLLRAAGFRQAQGSSFPGEKSIGIAAGSAGLLFGIHPLHVESAVWISERKDVLCAFFVLLSLLAYMSYADARAGRAAGDRDRRALPPGAWYALSFAAFCLALASKPMAVSLPLALLILDWYPFGRIGNLRTAALAAAEKLPFLSAGAIVAVLTFIAQKTSAGAIVPDAVPPATRVLVSAQSLALYLAKLMVPVGLNALYPYPKSAHLFSLAYGGAALLILCITAFCLLAARREKLWLALWTFFVLTLLPVIGIVRVGYQSMADRYVYVPGIAFFLLCGLAAARLWEFAGAVPQRSAARGALIALGVAVCVVLSALTIGRIGQWKDTITLWNGVIAREPDNVPLAYNLRGIAFKDRGQFDLALADYDRAISLAPDYDEPYVNRGILRHLMGRSDLGLADFTTALRLHPGYVNALVSRGYVLMESGYLDLARGDLDAAVAADPSDGDARLNRGALFERLGLSEQALEDYSAAIDRDPLDAEACNNRGNLYQRAGKAESAARDFRRACDLGLTEACASADRGR